MNATISTRARRTASVIVATLAIAAASILGGASPASAAVQPKTVGTTVAFSSPTPYSTMVGGYAGNTYVTMYCWTDAAWSYGTNRWFRVAGLGYDPRSGRPTWIVGYVSANKVNPQTIVGRC